MKIEDLILKMKLIKTSLIKGYILLWLLTLTPNETHSQNCRLIPTDQTLEECVPEALNVFNNLHQGIILDSTILCLEAITISLFSYQFEYLQIDNKGNYLYHFFKNDSLRYTHSGDVFNNLDSLSMRLNPPFFIEGSFRFFCPPLRLTEEEFYCIRIFYNNKKCEFYGQDDILEVLANYQPLFNIPFFVLNLKNQLNSEFMRQNTKKRVGRVK